MTSLVVTGDMGADMAVREMQEHSHQTAGHALARQHEDKSYS